MTHLLKICITNFITNSTIFQGFYVGFQGIQGFYAGFKIFQIEFQVLQEV